MTSVASLSGAQRVQLTVRVFARVCLTPIDVLIIDATVRKDDGVSATALAESLQLPPAVLLPAVYSLKATMLDVVSANPDNEEKSREADVGLTVRIDYGKALPFIHVQMSRAFLSLLTVHEAALPGGLQRANHGKTSGSHFLCCPSCAAAHAVSELKGSRTCPFCRQDLSLRVATQIAEWQAQAQESRKPQASLPLVVPVAFERDVRLGRVAALMYELLSIRYYVTSDDTAPSAQSFLTPDEHQAMSSQHSALSLRYAQPPGFRVCVERRKRGRGAEAVQLPPWLRPEGVPLGSAEGTAQTVVASRVDGDLVCAAQLPEWALTDGFETVRLP